MVTFPAAERHRHLPVPNYTAWWTEALVWKQLAQSRYLSVLAGGRTSNLAITSPTLIRPRKRSLATVKLTHAIYVDLN